MRVGHESMQQRVMSNDRRGSVAKDEKKVTTMLSSWINAEVTSQRSWRAMTFSETSTK